MKVAGDNRMDTREKGTILIIDDDSRNIFALKAVLKAKGYQCVSAIDAREGLEQLVRQKDIGVVLLDMMMPDLDGYETLAEIRRGVRKDVPVFAVTAQAMVGDRERCIDAGANAYISKPIDVDQLTSLLDQYLD
jgi:two-component system cell cycle response regulator DivK